MIDMDKNDILQGASSYIDKFKGRIFVVKYGGSILDDEEASDSILDDIVTLHRYGMDIVLVHGGGARISQLMKEKGKEPKFVSGLRVTDEETAKIVDEALSMVNRHIVERIRAKGVEAESLVSREKLIIKGKKKDSAPHGDFIGDVDSVDIRHIHETIERDAVPVVSPVGVDSEGRVYNINADLAASEIAGALSAEKFIMLTNVKGVMTSKDEESSLISSLKQEDAHKLIAAGIIAGGMIPKVEAGILALIKGINKAHIISARIKNSLLLEILTDKGIGTELIR